MTPQIGNIRLVEHLSLQVSEIRGGHDALYKLIWMDSHETIWMKHIDTWAFNSPHKGEDPRGW
jgi:hypothetical protein